MRLSKPRAVGDSLVADGVALTSMKDACESHSAGNGKPVEWISWIIVSRSSMAKGSRLLALIVPIPPHRCGRGRDRRAVVLCSVLARLTRSRRTSCDSSQRP